MTAPTSAVILYDWSLLVVLKYENDPELTTTYYETRPADALMHISRVLALRERDAVFSLISCRRDVCRIGYLLSVISVIMQRPSSVI